VHWSVKSIAALWHIRSWFCVLIFFCNRQILYKSKICVIPLPGAIKAGKHLYNFNNLTNEREHPSQILLRKQTISWHTLFLAGINQEKIVAGKVTTVPEKLCSRFLNFLILFGCCQQSKVQIHISRRITFSAPCTKESWPCYCCPASKYTLHYCILVTCYTCFFETILGQSINQDLVAIFQSWLIAKFYTTSKLRNS